jgi:outer membrane protein OmpA-like peptidoglycan-associated protein
LNFQGNNMKPSALVLALLTTASTLPGSAHAADDFCSRIFIYAVNQICHLLPNGQSVCQPIGLAAPAPNCQTPGVQPMVVPLGPPTLQLPAFPSFAGTPSPYAPPAYFANPYAQNPYAPNPYASALTYPAPTLPVTAAPPASVANEATTDAPALKALTKLMPESAAAASPPAPATAKLPPPDAPPAHETKPTAKATAPASQPTPAPAPATVAKAASETALSPVVAATTPAATPSAAPEPVAAAPAAQPTASVAMAAPVEIKPAVAASSVPTSASAKEEDALAHFAFDSAELTEAGRSMLDAWLAKKSDPLPIQVSGYTDRLGPEPYNEKLSLLRAEAVKKYLTEKGKPANQIQVLGKGETMPLVRCAGGPNPTTKACLAPNRRAEVTTKPVLKAPVSPKHKTAAKPKIKPKAKPKHGAKPKTAH